MKWNFVWVFSSVQSLSHVQLFATPWIAARQASLSITDSWSSLRLTSIESVMPSSHLILCRPLLLLPPIPPSIKVFSNESTLCRRWPNYWSFSLSIIPSKEIPGLIAFRMDWLDPLQSKGLSRVFSNTTTWIYMNCYRYCLMLRRHWDLLFGSFASCVFLETVFCSPGLTFLVWNIQGCTGSHPALKILRNKTSQTWSFRKQLILVS